MGRSRCLMFVSLLVLVPCLFSFSSATAAPDVGGRRSLLQAPTPQATPPTPRATPPTPRATPPTPVATPPTSTATPPTTTATPPTTTATPPTTTATPPTTTATPPTTTATPPTTTATPPVQPGALPPIVPGPSPFIAPAPAPFGPTSRQKANAAIAGGVIGSVLFIAVVLIFCRCNCIRRSKKMPFQRLQMT